MAIAEKGLNCTALRIGSRLGQLTSGCRYVDTKGQDKSGAEIGSLTQRHKWLDTFREARNAAGHGTSLVALEKLHCAFVVFRFGPGLKGSKIAALAGLGISLSRIEPVFAGFQLPNHMILLLSSAEKRPRAWALTLWPRPCGLLSGSPKRIVHVLFLRNECRFAWFH